MTASDFARCLPIILREEGGNDDDVHDHGGRTSRGIIQREWDRFRKTHPGRPADVWEASDDDIAAIYESEYWQPYCPAMQAGVALCFFNAAVNSGTRQAAKELQRALGVDDDGLIGPITLAALHAYAGHAELIADLSERRRRFYRSLAQCPRYCKGWLARTDRVEREALAMGVKKTLPQKARRLPKPKLLGRAKAYPDR